MPSLEGEGELAAVDRYSMTFTPIKQWYNKPFIGSTTGIQ